MSLSSRAEPARDLFARRLTYGVTPALRRDMAGYSSPTAWVEAQIDRAEPEYDLAATVPLWFVALRNTPALAQLLDSRGVRPRYQVGLDLVAQTLALRILSRHQLYEAMCDFWSNLLYIPVAEARSFAWRADFDTTVIRDHAFGRFPDMLAASVEHPAMATYLSNDLNAKGAINENLGRELLELHTVGRDAYDESDVRSMSRLLTGFTVTTGNTSQCGYDPNRHQTGKARVLGHTEANQNADGRAALARTLRHLALHEATARRIAQRLCTRFLEDSPPADLVRAVAASYRRSGGATAPMLRTLVKHPAFADARAAKVLKPGDDLVRACRVLGLQPSGAVGSGAFIRQLVLMAQDVGQVSYAWPAPNGWPETDAPYLNPTRLLRSWEKHYLLAAPKVAATQQVQVPAKATQLPSSWPQTLASLADHQSRLLLGRAADRALVQACASALGRKANASYASADALTDLEYQLLRGTVLNQPAGIRR